MRFNQEKWERLQRQRELLQVEYRLLSEELDDARTKENSTLNWLVENFDRSRQAVRVINEDRKLPYSDFKKRAEEIKENWAFIHNQFGFRQDDAGRKPLFELYDQILVSKLADDKREKFSERREAFGASWNRLEEFAMKHVNQVKVVHGERYE